MVGYGSRRQQCIAMSSTEAEVIAASQAALEIVFMRTLLRELGVNVSAPTVLRVDNSGAVELSKHRKSCQRSRHVMRRYLKVRELVAEGEIVVEWVDTNDSGTRIQIRYWSPSDGGFVKQWVDWTLPKKEVSNV